MSSRIEVQDREPSMAERDAAFAAGWRAEKILDNPYSGNGALPRIFVDGWAVRFRCKRLGLIV